MKKERLFYLDFIRAFATFLIVLTHYNAIFIYNCNRPELRVISLFPFNIYIGGLGVSLFLIISGASLMYNYGMRDKFEIKRFYIKRALNLYPAFWIAYLIFFSYYVLSSGGYPFAYPKWKYIFSFLGLDGFLTSYHVVTPYLVGEWFLGFIIILYLIFPLLMKGVNNFPILTAFIGVGLYVGSSILFKGKSWLPVFPLVRIPEILFGMYFVKYIKKVPWYVAALAVVLLTVQTIIKPNFAEQIPVTYVGILAFLVLVFVCEYIGFYWVKNISSVVCKYSYACFLMHHQIIYIIMTKLDLENMSKISSYSLFVAIGLLVIIGSFVLQKMADCTLKLFQQNVKKEQN